MSKEYRLAAINLGSDGCQCALRKTTQVTQFLRLKNIDPSELVEKILSSNRCKQATEGDLAPNLFRI